MVSAESPDLIFASEMCCIDAYYRVGELSKSSQHITTALNHISSAGTDDWAVKSIGILGRGCIEYGFREQAHRCLDSCIHYIGSYSHTTLEDVPNLYSIGILSSSVDEYSVADSLLSLADSLVVMMARVSSRENTTDAEKRHGCLNMSLGRCGKDSGSRR